MSKRFMYILFIAALIPLTVSAVRRQQSVTDQEYAAQVLDQYIKYYCPSAGVCSRQKALRRLRRDWPHVYKLGFQILEN